ncbi:MAG TPA: chemotaxis protein CheX [Bacteroidales bacterium]|nr:chemotaxis protein CheX [Bacteroidales bacterium]
MSNSYKDKIYDIAVNIFEVTCCMFPLEEWEFEDAKIQPISVDGVRSVIGFNGAANGEMIIIPSSELYSAIAANMLGVEEPDETQKSGALCEIANIICGNTVPLFADTEHICYIEHPRIIESKEEMPSRPDNAKEEVLQLYLDEGQAEIKIYYSIKGGS